MADNDYSPIPTQDQKNFSDSLKNSTGRNPNSLWNKITGSSTEPTPEEKMKAIQKRGSGSTEGF